MSLLVLLDFPGDDLSLLLLWRKLFLSIFIFYLLIELRTHPLSLHLLIFLSIHSQCRTSMSIFFHLTLLSNFRCRFRLPQSNLPSFHPSTPSPRAEIRLPHLRTRFALFRPIASHPCRQSLSRLLSRSCLHPFEFALQSLIFAQVESVGHDEWRGFLYCELRRDNRRLERRRD